MVIRFGHTKIIHDLEKSSFSGIIVWIQTEVHCDNKVKRRRVPSHYITIVWYNNSITNSLAFMTIGLMATFLLAIHDLWNS